MRTDVSESQTPARMFIGRNESNNRILMAYGMAVKRKNKRRRKPAQPHSHVKNTPEIPPKLDTAEFRAAWTEWIEYRRQARKPLTPLTVSRQLGKLSEVGPSVAVKMIERSIEKGWQGLIFPSEENGRDGQSKHYRPGAAEKIPAGVVHDFSQAPAPAAPAEVKA